MTRGHFLAVIAGVFTAPFLWMKPTVDDFEHYSHVWHCEPPPEDLQFFITKCELEKIGERWYWHIYEWDERIEWFGQRLTADEFNEMIDARRKAFDIAFESAPKTYINFETPVTNSGMA